LALYNHSKTFIITGKNHVLPSFLAYLCLYSHSKISETPKMTDLKSWSILFAVNYNLILSTQMYLSVKTLTGKLID